MSAPRCFLCHEPICHVQLEAGLEFLMESAPGVWLAVTCPDCPPAVIAPCQRKEATV